MKKLKNILAALTALAVIPLAASATVVVDFTATATADTDGVGYASGTDDVPYSFTTARNPGIGSNGYGDSPDTSAVFYGGAAWTGTGSGLNDKPYLESTDGSWRYRLGAAIGDSMGAVQLWKKADFLNGLDSQAVSFDAASSMSVRTDEFGSGFGGDIRFVVQDGSTMYISSATAFLDGGATTTLSDPDSASWFAYDPATSIMTVGAAATPTFSDITAVGVYFEITASTEGNKTFAFDDFQVDAIPEPVTAGLLGFASLAMLAIRRFRG